jgi:hypothetical protein
MPASDEFKAKIKTGKIAEALAVAIGEAAELQITTWVSKETDIEAVAGNTELESIEPGHRLQTKINLIDNKIENELGERFLDNGLYSGLRQFHQEQVKDSPQLMENNISNLQKLLGIWARLHDRGAEALALELEPLAATSQPLPSAEPTVASTAIASPEPAVEELPVEMADETSTVTPPSSQDRLSIGTAATLGTLGIASLGIAALGREQSESSATSSPVVEPELDPTPSESDELESLAPPPAVEAEAAAEEEWEAPPPPVRSEPVAEEAEEEEEEWEAPPLPVRSEPVAEEEEWEGTSPLAFEPEEGSVEPLATAMPSEAIAEIDTAIPGSDNWNLEALDATTPPDVEPSLESNAAWNLDPFATPTPPEVEAGGESWNLEAVEPSLESNVGWNLDPIATPPSPEGETDNGSWNLESLDATIPPSDEPLLESDEQWSLEGLDTTIPPSDEPLLESDEQWDLDAIATPATSEADLDLESNTPDSDDWNLGSLELPTTEDDIPTAESQPWAIDASNSLLETPQEDLSAADIDPFSSPLTSSLDNLQLNREEEWDNWLVEEEEPERLSSLGEIELDADDELADFNLQNWDLPPEASPTSASSNLDSLTGSFPETNGSEDFLLYSQLSNGDRADSDIDLDGEWEDLFAESSLTESQTSPQMTTEDGNEASQIDDLSQWIDDDELFADLMSPERQPPSPPATDRFTNENQ